MHLRADVVGCLVGGPTGRGADRDHGRGCRGGVRAGLLAFGLSLALVVLAASPGLAAFPDVPAGHRYRAAIDDLVQRHVIEGYADGTFGPNDPILRQQFAKMVVLTLGLPVSEGDVCPFSDVTVGGPGTFYPDNYVAKAASSGITLGFSPTAFGPYQSITRAQVISMVVRAADGMAPGTLVAPPAGYISTWDPAFSQDHGQNARRAQFNGLLVGLPLAQLDPWGMMPRGEVAQVLHNLLGKLSSGGPHQTSHLLHFWWTPAGGWQVFDVSQQLGIAVTGPVAAWLSYYGPSSPADMQIAAVDTVGSLHVFSSREGQNQWTSFDVGKAVGKTLMPGIANWVLTPPGKLPERHFAAVGSAGELVHIWGPQGMGWQSESITIYGGQMSDPPSTVVGVPAAWAREQSDASEHVAARLQGGGLVDVHRSSVQGWSGWSIDYVTGQTGRSIAGDPVGWQEPYFSPWGGGWTDYIAAPGPQGELLVFSSTGTAWMVEDVSAGLQHQKIEGRLTQWKGQYTHLAARAVSGDLLVFTRGGSGWQVENVSAKTGGRTIEGPIASYFTDWTGAGPNLVQHVVATRATGELLIFYQIEGSATWLVDSVTEATGRKVLGPAAPWFTDPGNPGQADHLAGVALP